MRSPAEALQRAIYKALTTSSTVQAAFGASPPRVWDEVRPDPTFPYVVIGDDQILDDSNCGAAWEANSTIHVFSRDQKRGKTAAKDLGDAIVDALATELEIDGCVSVHADDDPPFESARYFTEPDGKTAHGVLVFRFLIDPA